MQQRVTTWRSWERSKSNKGYVPLNNYFHLHIIRRDGGGLVEYQVIPMQLLVSLFPYMVILHHMFSRWCWWELSGWFHALAELAGTKISPLTDPRTGVQFAGYPEYRQQLVGGLDEGLYGWSGIFERTFNITGLYNNTNSMYTSISLRRITP